MNAAGRGGAQSLPPRRMSLSEAEFLHHLPRALVRYSWRRIGPGALEVQLPPGRARISHAQAPALRLGALTLPVTVLEFRFEQCAPRRIESFLAAFERSFRRGGG